jgi:hypothetical protein
MEVPRSGAVVDIVAVVLVAAGVEAGTVVAGASVVAGAVGAAELGAVVGLAGALVAVASPAGAGVGPVLQANNARSINQTRLLPHNCHRVRNPRPPPRDHTTMAPV